MAGSTSNAPLGEQYGLAIDGYNVLRVMNASPSDNVDEQSDHYLGSRGEQRLVRVISGEVTFNAREADEIHWLMSVLAGYLPDADVIHPWVGPSVETDVVANQMNEQDDAVIRSWIAVGANGPLPRPTGDGASYMERSGTLTSNLILEFDYAPIQTTMVTLTPSGAGWSGSLGFSPQQNPARSYQQSGLYALSVQVALASGTSITKWDTPPNAKHVKVTAAMVSSSGVVLIQQDDLDDADLVGTTVSGALVSALLTGGVPSHTGLYG